MAEIDHVDVCIVGGGISGLSLAYFLKNIGHSVFLIEQNETLGGVISSSYKNSFLLEQGPQTFQLEPVVELLLKELSIYDQIVKPQSNVKNRYIGNIKDIPFIKPIPDTLKSFAVSDLISLRSKCALIGEYIGKFKKGKDKNPSLYQLMVERFGAEITENIVSAAYIGVWASSIKNLGVKETSPIMYQAYKKGNSLLKSVVKNIRKTRKFSGTYKIASLRNGLSSLVDALAKNITEQSYSTSTVVHKLFYNEDWNITFERNGTTECLRANALVLAIPSPSILSIVNKLDTEYDLTFLEDILKNISYSPIGIIHVAVPEESRNKNLDGFGVLIPENKSKALLGCIYSGVLFPERNNGRKILLTCFVGGSIYPEMTDVDRTETQEIVLDELTKVLDIKSRPEIISSYKWHNAIPQYKPEHKRNMNQLKEHISKLPNLYLASNIDQGVSIPARIKHSLKLSTKITLDL